MLLAALLFIGRAALLKVNSTVFNEGFLMELPDFFKRHSKVALAFSGGVDSSYLLYSAIDSGADAHAYYVKSAFQPRFELNDAERMAKLLHADMTVIELDVLDNPMIASNPMDRCYYCKKLIFSAIAKQAKADGYSILLDGTNASDDADDRPGMRAIKELAVLSPLRECELTKDRIRQLSKEAGLFTWDKPAYACLATRISAQDITEEKLEWTECAENHLFSLGFSDFRVRMTGTSAKIQISAAQFQLLAEKRDSIVRELKKYYSSVLLDMEARDE